MLNACFNLNKKIGPNKFMHKERQRDQVHSYDDDIDNKLIINNSTCIFNQIS